ncbi:MAG: polysaccharide deacetylase family protein [Pseudomonadota bacterium]
MLFKLILNGLYFTGLQAVAAPFFRGMGGILMLHHVRDERKAPFSPNYHLSVSPSFLEQLIISLKANGFDFISMDEVSKRLSDPDAYQNAKPFVCMTLDDGYRDNLENAVPIFQKHNIPYLIYIAPGLTQAEAHLWWEDLERIIAGRDSFYMELHGETREIDVSSDRQKNDVYSQLMHYFMNEVDEQTQRKIMAEFSHTHSVDADGHVAREVMDWNVLTELSRDPLCTFGAHTIGHFAVAKLDDTTLKYELEQSRKIIEMETGQRVKHFAYPYGFPSVAGKREFKVAQDCGYETAVTTRHGVIYPAHRKHMTALPRISINGNFQSSHYVKTLLSGVPTILNNKGKKLSVA